MILNLLKKKKQNNEPIKVAQIIKKNNDVEDFLNS